MASVTKLFTTGTALSRLGPASTLETTVWSRTESVDGVAMGGIVLVGDGDPTLAGSGIAKLAKRIATAGITRVQGPVFYDASNFDLRTTVPQTGVTGGPYLGSLSGLSYGWGWGDSGPVSNPADSAASELAAEEADTVDGPSSGPALLALRDALSLAWRMLLLWLALLAVFVLAWLVN